MRKHSSDTQAVQEYYLQLLQFREFLPDLLEADFFNDLAAEVDQIMQTDRLAICFPLFPQLFLELRCVFLVQSLEEPLGLVRRPRRTDKRPDCRLLALAYIKRLNYERMSQGEI